ncbi:MAG: TauD/TfdA family dioxygenase [bacterium]|nr:TauD/TfdA family dioxygenase [bacterium]
MSEVTAIADPERLVFECRCERCWVAASDERVQPLGMRGVLVDVVPGGPDELLVAWREQGSGIEHEYAIHAADLGAAAPSVAAAEREFKIVEMTPGEFIERSEACGSRGDLERDGAILVREVGVGDDPVAFLRALAPLRDCFWGPAHILEPRERFDSIGFSRHRLELHTDMPSYVWPPSVLALLCLQQARQGGETTVADVALARKALERDDPDAAILLGDTRLQFRHEHADRSVCHWAPMFDKGVGGRPIYRISHHASRLGLGTGGDFLGAYRQLMDLLVESAHTVVLEPSDLLLLDNHVMVHGRAPFVGERTMCVAYMELDDL